ncbi:MAG: type II toxin-antitoxin system RelE/ParE family toxin [Xenococcaceae cyanobacterium MO_167.B52]|nr:type II toxin-antitoxin system RelE/ParE family toxin [Xenococcaceae cyanobacterium MO_167.B52]
MKYQVQFNPKAIKDFKKLSPDIQKRVSSKITTMQDDLQGDIKKLTNFEPEYRLRVGDYRVLFEIEDNNLIIYRIKHRRSAYQ